MMLCNTPVPTIVTPTHPNSTLHETITDLLNSLSSVYSSPRYGYNYKPSRMSLHQHHRPIRPRLPEPATYNVIQMPLSTCWSGPCSTASWEECACLEELFVAETSVIEVSGTCSVCLSI